MGYRLTEECREIIDAARQAGGSIYLMQPDGGDFVMVGRRSFLGDGQRPDPRTMRRYRDALNLLVGIGFVEYMSGQLYELTTRGWEGDLSELSIADEADDYLGMAEHLDDKGYRIAAAGVAGAVLEDSLRRLHLARIGPWSGESKLSTLNDGLRNAGVYEQPVWRQIQVWADIRNDADHGHFEKVDSDQVKQMIFGIRDFVARHER